eukprot:scaffold13457_cov153-Skeletonema_dohrnii-CCMP3373.AAC.1
MYEGGGVCEERAIERELSSYGHFEYDWSDDTLSTLCNDDNDACSGVNGALFEMGILILRNEAAPTVGLFAVVYSHQHTSSKNDNGHILPPSRPMRAMSGVLESP